MANVSSSNGLEKYPKLRFPGFEEPYRALCLGNIATSVNRTDPESMANIMMLSAGKGFIMQSDKYSRDNAGQSLKKYILLKKGELAYNHGASKAKQYGCCYELLEDEARIPYVYHCFKIDEKEFTPYVALELNNPKMDKQLKRLVSSSARMDGLLNISFDDYMSVRLTLPSYFEQMKIADFLNTIDRRIELQRALVESLKKYKRGVIRTLLTPEYCKFKDAKWTSARIGDLGSFIKGAPLSKADIADEGTPFILYGELYTTYNEVITQIVRKTKANVEQQYFSQIGDVIIPTSGETPEEISTASCVMVPGVILGGDLNIFRCSKVDGRIISYILNHVVSRNIARIAQGKSVVHVQANELAKIEIAYPDFKTQENMVTLFEAINAKIAQRTKELELLLEQRRALLQQVFI